MARIPPGFNQVAVTRFDAIVPPKQFGGVPGGIENMSLWTSFGGFPPLVATGKGCLAAHVVDIEVPVVH
jgi:hypothetical protein